MAACAANKQGKFHEMSEKIWGGFEQRKFKAEDMTAYAQELGLDLNKFKADMESADCKKWFEESQQTLRKFGASGTPAFFINGRFISGAQPLPAFEKIINEELEKAKKSGVPSGEYYDKVVVGKGLKELKEED